MNFGETEFVYFVESRMVYSIGIVESTMHGLSIGLFYIYIVYIIMTKIQNLAWAQ